MIEVALTSKGTSENIREAKARYSPGLDDLIGLYHIKSSRAAILLSHKGLRAGDLLGKKTIGFGPINLI